MSRFPFKRKQRVSTPDGRGTIIKYDYGRCGVLHDVYPVNKPVGMYTQNILYYYRHDFPQGHQHVN